MKCLRGLKVFFCLCKDGEGWVWKQPCSKLKVVSDTRNACLLERVEIGI